MQSIPKSTYYPAKPVAVVLSGDKFYFSTPNGYFTRDGYNAYTVAKINNSLSTSIRQYPKASDIKAQLQIKSLSYMHNEVQYERHRDRLLKGLVIDIIKTVPSVSSVTKHLNSLLAMGEDSAFIDYLEGLETLGIVSYDSYRGRYITTENEDMIICICLKTHLEKGSIDANAFFNNDGQCKFCYATLHNIEQISDPNGMTDQALIYGSNNNAEDDIYINIRTLLDIILDQLRDSFRTNGWIISSTDQDMLMGELESADGIDLNPYGQEVRTTVTSDANGDLRGFIQQGYRNVQLFEAHSKSLKFNKSFFHGGSAFDLHEFITRYLLNNMPGASKDAVKGKLKFGDDAESALSLLKRITGKNKHSELAKDTDIIMYYFTLPIFSAQATNTAIICAYVTSLLELKYGTKNASGQYMTPRGNEISAIVTAEVTHEFIHLVANKFSQVLRNKCDTTAKLLISAGADGKQACAYYTALANMYGANTFNSDFTEFHEDLFQVKGVSLMTSVLNRYKTGVTRLRTAKSAEYSKKLVGDAPKVNEDRVSMFYTVADADMLTTTEKVKSLQGFNDCVESAKQLTYHNFLEGLRDGYNMVSELAGDLPEDKLSALTKVAYLANGRETMAMPKDDTGKQLHADTAEFRIETEEYNSNICAYLADNIRRTNTNDMPGYNYNFNIPVKQAVTPAGMLADRSLSMSDLYSDPSIVTKFRNLTRLYDQDLASKKISTLFDVQHMDYISMGIPNPSLMCITVMYNEQMKKAQQMPNISIFGEGVYPEVPDFLGHNVKDDNKLLPWGMVRQHDIDIALRRALAIQNIGKALVKIFRWISNPDIPLEDLKKSISKSKESNVVGVNMNEVERDGIDTSGYVLEALLNIKIELMQEQEAYRDDMQLGSYSAHFMEFYTMSFSEFRRTYGSPVSTITFLDLLMVCIKTDIIKHLEYIDQKNRNDVAPVNIDREFGQGNQRGFVTYAGKVLDALHASANGSIVEPDRQLIDKLYDLRFMENANKRKINTAKSIKDRTGMNINTPYAGKLKGQRIDQDDDDDGDMDNEDGAVDEGGEDDGIIDNEGPEDPDMDEYEMDGIENGFNGEPEDEYYDPDVLD
jgi:hypothetical protein